MVLKTDFANTLQVFIYSNLPVLMNPANATNVVITNEIIPTTLISPTTTTATTTATTIATTIVNPITMPILIIPPDVLQALQTYTLNNFPNIGLPQDIQEIVKNFLSNLPPLVSLTPTTSIPITAPTPITTVTTTS